MQTASLQVQDFDKQVIEQVIAGVQQQDLQNELLNKDSTFTLDLALDLGRTFETSSCRHMEELDKIQTT